MCGPSAGVLSDHQGFYFKYFYTYLGGRRVKRELAHWYYDKDVLVSSVKQRYPGEDEAGEATLRFITDRDLVGTWATG